MDFVLCDHLLLHLSNGMFSFSNSVLRRCRRVLQDEFEKREQLEELKESLEELLQQEQVKSSELEERRREQEKMLADEQERLEKLEQERQMRDQQYEVRFNLI